ncbi:MAG: hypothetical protein U9N80_11760 [Chloroflexota bacterium]|nr:hypothetical protein [Chloroflexota bacterium]
MLKTEASTLMFLKIPESGSLPNYVGDLADLRCGAPPDVKLLVHAGDDGGSRFYPPITSGMTNLQAQTHTSRRRLRLRPEAELPHSTYNKQPLTSARRTTMFIP